MFILMYSKRKFNKFSKILNENQILFKFGYEQINSRKYRICLHIDNNLKNNSEKYEIFNNALDLLNIKKFSNPKN